MVECPVATARANVMPYDSEASTWVPSGPGQGVSKVQLYHNQETNAYRVVGWRLQDREVVLNCAIARGLKYHQARPTFHQWRDSKQQVYGLNFTSVDEATTFATAVQEALDSLAALHRKQAAAAQQQQLPVMQQQTPSVPQQLTQFNQTVQQNNQQIPLQEQNSIVVSSGYGNLPQLQQPTSRQMTSVEYALPDRGYNTAANGGAFLMNNGTGDSHGSVDSRYQSSSDDSVKVMNYPKVNQPCAMANNEPQAQNNIPWSQMHQTSQQPQPDPADCSRAMHIQGNPSASTRNVVAPTVMPSQVPTVATPLTPPPAPPAPPPPPIPPPPPPPPGPGSNLVSGRPLARPVHNCASAITNQGVAKPSDDTGDDDEGVISGGFAAQLRQARQQRMRAASVAVGASDQNGLPAIGGPLNAPSGSGTLGRSGGADMMSDLQRVLAARRRAKEAEEGNGSSNVAGGDTPATSSSLQSNTSSRWNQQNQSTSITPGFATLRKNSSPALDAMTTNNSTNGFAASNSSSSALLCRADLDAFKRELMTEFRREVQQLKNDVIEALRAANLRG